MRDFVKKMKEDSRNYKQDAGTIMKTHDELKLIVKNLLSSSVAAQRTAMKKKLDERKRFVMKRDNPQYVETEETERTPRRICKDPSELIRLINFFQRFRETQRMGIVPLGGGAGLR